VKAIDLSHNAFIFISAVALCLVVSDACAQLQNSNASAQQQNQDKEVQLGQEVFKKHFRKDPSVFAKYNSDPKSAAPFVVPKNVAEVFMH
jgi:hypothetical protein